MHGEKKTLFIEVILPLPIEKFFTYRVPSEMNDEIALGKRVAVYFGGQKVYAALIRNIRTKPPQGYQATYIIQVLDEFPIIQEREFVFWDWVAKYYMSAIGDVMNNALPAGLKLKNDSKIVIAYEEIPKDLALDEKELTILNILEKDKSVKLSDISNLLDLKSGLKYVKSLHDKGLITIQENIKEKYSAKMVRHLSLAPEFKNEYFTKEILDKLESKAPKQVNVLIAMLSEGVISIPKSNFITKNGLSSSSISTLIKKGLIAETLHKTNRIERKSMSLHTLTLSPEQEIATNEILDGFKEEKPVLLYGSTYSGKSYIFSYIARQMIENGKQVLYLLPEVAITEEFHRRLEKYFGADMVSVHSKFNLNEKVEIWDEIKTNKAKLIVGPRNSVFMPFQDLGLIIVDEEHENSYKQGEKSPRFNGKDVALYLSKSWRCPIILGSATPSIESYYLAMQDKYKLVKLTSAFHKKPSPTFELIDTKQEKKADRMKSFISDKLYELIQENFKEKKQAIFFQNRKGYVPITECNVCGWTQKCINCDITLTYYKYTNNLRCHYCGYHESTVSVCPDCGSSELQTQGAGTELITEELEILFPESNIERFDQESTRGKTKVRQLLDGFNSGTIDALVGTQIVVKGMSFNNVHLAAVIQADQLLNFPDFRAYERAFQLIVQLAGRVGTEKDAGKVVIQTSQSGHVMMDYITNRDFKGFYHKEITEREQYFYPPFSRVILIQLRHKIPQTVEQAAKQMAHYLKTDYGTKILGPESPHIARIRNLYIQQILVKLDRDKDSSTQIKSRIRQIGNHLRGMKEYKSVRITYNVDPQ